MDFYFQDHLRLDWGFGNPNKTAALISCLLVLVHFLRYVGSPKVGRILFSIAFVGLGICLVHTYSRGGIVAAISGQIVFALARVAWAEQRPARSEVTVTLVLILLVAVYSFLPSVNAASRYGLGIGGDANEDLSITNRLRIWKDAPTMMVDAPGGWGKGGAGVGWMEWYQPLETRYQYRTLVNSHLTWLVELGWVGRFLYLSTWLGIFAFLMLWGNKSINARRNSGIALGVWASFAVSAFFSSVGEALGLWILPVAVLLWVLIRERRWMEWKKGALLSISFAGLMLGLFYVSGKIATHDGEMRIRHRGDYIVVGDQEPTRILIEPDPDILGRHFGHAIRKQNSGSWMIVESYEKVEGLPVQSSRVVLSGDFPEGALTLPAVVILNPTKVIHELPDPDAEWLIVMGSLRKDPVARAITNTFGNEQHTNILLAPRAGKKLFLGTWPELVPETSL